MTFKKTWLSYLLWAVFTCIMGVMLANYTILLWKKEIDVTVNYGTILFVFLVFAIVAGIYFLLRKILYKIKNVCQISERSALLWESFIVLSIFFAGLLYRFCLCMQGKPEVTQYYYLATIKAEEAMEPLLHGASYLYTLCLSFVFSFLGNKVAAAVWFQGFIQMITLLLAFFVVRKMAGRIPACVAMLVLAFSSVYAGQILAMTPESLFFLLYLTGFFIVGGFVRNFNHNYRGTGTAICGAFISGIVVGILTYLDAIALTLVVLFFALLCGAHENQATHEEEKAPPFAFKLFLFMSAVLSAVLIFLGMFALDAYICLLPIGEVTKAWFALYGQHLLIDYLLYQTNVSIVECFILVIFASFLIMAFWNRKKEENAALWIVLMLLLAPTPLASVGVLSYQVYAVFIWGVLAGIGLQQSFVIESVKSVKEITKLENTSLSDFKLHTEECQKHAFFSRIVCATIGGMKSACAAPEGVEKTLTEKFEKAPVETPEPVSKPRFLENPLPLPKKHERRTMDYEYEVPADKMKFDIEVKEDDDFDLK